MPEKSDKAVLVSVARSLRIDVVTGEVVGALRRAGVRPLLFKGPVLSRWLYSGDARPYVDTDLLVPPEKFDTAERVLAGLGFEVLAEGAETVPHAHAWIRARDGANVDLHRGLWGVGVSWDEVWKVLRRESEETSVGGVEVEHFGPAASAFHLALHLAQHGMDTKPREDLARALARAEPETWDRAAAIAEDVQAVPAFAAGLRQLPEGEAEAERLGLSRSIPLDVALRAGRQRTVVADGYRRLFEAPTARGKLALLARELFPTATFMRAWSALARKGRLGLFLAYLWRPWWLLAKTPRALLTLRAARKEARPG